LRVSFGESLDHALAMRLITVVDSNDSPVAGRALLGERDRVWSFTPDTNWSAGRLTLRVEPALEDLAGNNLARPFDSDRAHGGASAETALADTSPRRIALTFRDSAR